MKLAFVYWGYENAGSMLDLRGYARGIERDAGGGGERPVRPRVRGHEGEQHGAESDQHVRPQPGLVIAELPFQPDRTPEPRGHREAGQALERADVGHEK